jgi:Domain of unknown function (DUF1906)
MTTPGIDSPINCGGAGAAIKTAGMTFVGRYYRNQLSSWPALKAAEVTALHGAGLKVVALWESASATPGHFSRKAGMDEGTSAYHQAFQAGQPFATPIYFAVDYDASDVDLAGPIDEYFVAVAAAFAAMGDAKSQFAIGVYGSPRTCARLQARGRATYFWLADAPKWGVGVPFADWHIKQSKATGNLVKNYDEDVAQPGFGGF